VKREGPAIALLIWCLPLLAQQPLEEIRVHEHQPLVLPEGYREPTLDIELYPDAGNGFNLQVLVSNYQLEPPEKAGQAPAGIAEGHAHLMVNGKKRIRIYGEWLHLDQSLFRPGINQLTVTLNSHDHYSWVIGRQPVLATVFVDPQKTPPVQHRFASHPAAK
jgi:hypothetical protein